jgi:anti-sigma regulatory factor (Ser/Thr protein kinase)
VGRLLAAESEARQLTRRLPPTPASVFIARRFTSQLLHEWEISEDTVDEVELVISELVTNAARHSEEFVEVRLSCNDDVVRIEVEDTSHRMPDIPTSSEVDEESTGGRGLLIVDAVAARWGVESQGLSKCVWAEFDLADDHSVGSRAASAPTPFAAGGDIAMPTGLDVPELLRRADARDLAAARRDTAARDRDESAVEAEAEADADAAARAAEDADGEPDVDATETSAAEHTRDQASIDRALAAKDRDDAAGERADLLDAHRRSLDGLDED